MFGLFQTLFQTYKTLSGSEMKLERSFEFFQWSFKAFHKAFKVFIINKWNTCLDCSRHCPKHNGRVQQVYQSWTIVRMRAFNVFIVVGIHVWTIPDVQSILDTFRKCIKARSIVRIVLIIVQGIYRAFKVFIIIGIHVWSIPDTVPNIWDPFKKC